MLSSSRNRGSYSSNLPQKRDFNDFTVILIHGFAVYEMFIAQLISFETNYMYLETPGE